MSNTKIKPITGAAEYFGGYDYENAKKPCVFMKTHDSNEAYTSVIEYAKTIESAHKKAEKWQKRENASVRKHHHHPDHVNQ